MRETIQKFFQTRQAKLGLAAVCIAVVLILAFVLQPSASTGAPVADVSAGEQADSSQSSAALPEDGQGESSRSAPEETAGGSSSANGQTDASSPASTTGSQPSASSQSPDSAPPGTGTTPDTGKDRYETDPVPEGKPAPVEPEDTVVDEDKQYTCTLSIRCDTILNNMDRLKEEKKAIVPADGVILATTTVTFREGESVFDVLKRVTREQRIHMEFSFNPIFNSAYIEGIYNLYEFDCGNLSGWLYRVNGWIPNYGCSRYPLKQGDVVEWVYTCEQGKDIGGSVIGQGESQ